VTTRTHLIIAHIGASHLWCITTLASFSFSSSRDRYVGIETKVKRIILVARILGRLLSLVLAM